MTMAMWPNPTNRSARPKNPAAREHRILKGVTCITQFDRVFRKIVSSLALLSDLRRIGPEPDDAC